MAESEGLSSVGKLTFLPPPVSLAFIDTMASSPDEEGPFTARSDHKQTAPKGAAGFWRRVSPYNLSPLPVFRVQGSVKYCLFTAIFCAVSFIDVL